MNKKIPHYQQDYYKGIAGIYFHMILNELIRMGDLKNEPGLILDYGCGVGHLKKKLPDRNVIGYDINPDLSEVEDYRDLRPSKIVFSAMLQYLTLDKIDELMQYCLKTGAELLTVQPTENIFSKIAMFLANQPYAHDDHIVRYWEINGVIEKYYNIMDRKFMFLRMVQLTRYRKKYGNPK